MPAAICATLPENLDADTRKALIAKGIAPMQGIHECLNAISQAAHWSAARERILAGRPEPLRQAQPLGATEIITEADGKAWLASAGISVPKGIVATGKGAADAATGLGFPVALKMLSPKIAHKTEFGAVALGLADAASVVAAVDQMRRKVSSHDEKALTDTFLVECMSPMPIAELIVGIRRDPQFGHALTLGSGGILVELVGDSKTLLLPCSAGEIEAALQALRIGALMRGFRGNATANVPALAKTLEQLCTAVLNAADEIHDIEINPLFVGTDDAVAVDVLMHKASK